MTDETNPPSDADEPKPGSTEWLLAQLSGGRIDSRRGRREAEAALEAAGVPIPDASTEQPAAEEPTADTSTETAASPDERPRARFSWETGTLEAVARGEAQGDAASAPAAADRSALPAQQPTTEEFTGDRAEAAPAAFPGQPSATSPGAFREAPREAASNPFPEAPRDEQALTEPAVGDSIDAFTAASIEPSQPAEPVIPFMWNLSPTDDPDPALNAPVEIPEPSFDEPDFPFPSAAPLVVPKPAPRPLITDAPTGEPSAEQQREAPRDGEPDGVPASAAAEPAQPADAAATSLFPDAEPSLPVPPSPPSHAPLPPGTTAHEFDPFAQDLFAPTEAITPVPSVDEFTIPDEDSPAQTSVPAQGEPGNAAVDDAPANGEQHVTSDWSDIADMLGAHPETVDNAIVSPMPPVNEILPSFDALLPRNAAQTPEEPAATEQAQAGPAAAPDHAPVPAAPAAAPAATSASSLFGQPLAEVPPPQQPAGAPLEHARGGSSLNRWLLIAAAILLLILIGIGLFALGRAFAAGRDQTPVASTHTATPTASTTPTPSATPTPTQTQTQDPAVAGSGPLPAGQSYQWDQLRGGECINPFSSAWAQQFAVVDCNAQHAAQLVYTAPFATDPSTPFPGAQAIASQINLLCSKPGVVDLHAAAAYSDVQVVGAYPVNADQWNSGQRNYFCFVTRSSKQPFTSSIAGPGPTK
ncbi:hypothetical protein GCM10022286_19020 [Gryllotalpicola daejeonensis]|uniref:Septum formation-related domain-containing protein n=1 Tax=Gryllotalpicola daejeonensis TaxID=993087 RepID=A0ABP7ZKD0_9MICO